MKNFRPSILLRFAALAVMGGLVVGWAWPVVSVAQDQTSDATTHKHAGRSTDADNDLSAQLQELKAKTATLEAALLKRYPGAAGKGMSGGKGMATMRGRMGMMGGKGMGMMGGSDDNEMAEMMKMMRSMMEMKMMQMKNKSMMDGMGGSMSGMQGEDMGMMGMGMMGGMTNNGMSGMQMPSALPGFPGASHIYHIGATGFFLDHPEHVQLTSEQQTALNGIKEKGLLNQASAQRKIDDAEQEIWTLTASDQPEAEKIEAKVREIEKLHSDQRLAFIRSVGEAARVLTNEQRKTLVDTMLPGTDIQH